MHQVLPARPDLSVVVVTHDGRALALATLQSATRAVGELAVECLVVDSGSTDGTPDAIAHSWPSMALTRLANVGFAAASDVALRAARGRYVLLLNPDVEIVSGTFAGLVRARGPSWSPSVPSGTERTAIGQPAMAGEDRGSV